MTPGEELLRHVLGGDVGAWHQLFSRYAPMVEKLARSNRSMGSLRKSDDDVRSVVAKVFERLRRNDFRALRTFSGWRTRHVAKTFDDWLTIVTVNVVRDHVAAQITRSGREAVSVEQLVRTLSDTLPRVGSALAELPHITTRETAQRIVEYARAHLPEDQLAALSHWLEGLTFVEMASEMRIADSRAAHQMVRAALARLRRQFSDG